MSAGRNARIPKPYVDWLGLPEANLAPNHYELLGLRLFEKDPTVVTQAYLRRVASVSQYQTGETAKQCKLLLTELLTAKTCLSDEIARVKYENRLKAELKVSQAQNQNEGNDPGIRSSDSRQDVPRGGAPRLPPASASKRENVSIATSGEYAKNVSSTTSGSPGGPGATSDRISRPGKRSAFGIISVARTPEEIFREIVATRGLTPYQAGKFIDHDAEELIVGPYILENEIGSGSYGSCFLASRVSTGDVVSLRLLPKTYTRRDDGTLRSAIKVAKRIESDRVQMSLDAGFDQGRCYIASTFVTGEDLYRLVKRNGPLTVEQSIQCILLAIEGLSAARKKGLSHHELRPSKLVVNRKGQISIRDFGIAQLMHHRKKSVANIHALVGALPRHHLDYIAPEVLLREYQEDFRADMYSLGCILYFLLTGKAMYEGLDPLRALLAHRDGPLPSIGKFVEGAPKALDLCFSRMVAKLPTKRFESYGQCHSALTEIAESLPRNALPLEKQWKIVDESASILVHPRQALRTISTKRLIALGAITLATVAVTTAAALYALSPSKIQSLVTDPSPTTSTKQTKAVAPNADSSVPIVEPETSFEF